MPITNYLKSAIACLSAGTAMGQPQRHKIRHNIWSGNINRTHGSKRELSELSQGAPSHDSSCCTKKGTVKGTSGSYRNALYSILDIQGSQGRQLCKLNLHAAQLRELTKCSRKGPDLLMKRLPGQHQARKVNFMNPHRWRHLCTIWQRRSLPTSDVDWN